MSNKGNKGPNPTDVLFKNLFGEHVPEESLELVSEGLSASRQNAERLLSDVKFLVEAHRLSSARFLLTTALEEIAKSYILVDMCRLDLNKHHSLLSRLCRAFYDHISKHAYLKVLDHPNIKSISDAKAVWEIEVTRWWPGSCEGGEPDIPHDTYFDREYPLYIDYGDYDRRWFVPADSDQNAYFTDMLGTTPISRTDALIEPWRTAEASGICSAKALTILNDVFKKHYVHEDTTWQELERSYQRVAERAVAEAGIAFEAFMISPCVQWPLYRFV